MTGTRIEIDDAEVRAALAALVAASEDLAPAMERIGGMLVASSLHRFESETGPDGRRWTPSIRALFEGGQTLTDRGHLRGSLTYAAGPTSVEVGTNLVYAAIHQLGGKAGRGHTAEIPARPYLGVDGDDRAEIVRILGDHLMGGVA